MRITEKGISKDSEIFLYHRTLLVPNPFFRFISITHCKADTTYTVNEFTYNGFLLLLVVKGEGNVTIRKSTKQLHANQLTLIDGRSKPSFETTTGIEYYRIIFDGIEKKDFLGNEEMRSVEVDGEEALPSFLALIEPFRNGRQPVNATVNNRLTTLLEHFVTEEEVQKFDYIYDYICSHLDQPLSVKDLANLAGLSSYYFIRAFNEECGMTPHEYVLKFRVYTATYLLSTTSMPLKEISRSCGFANESAFNNTFKRIKGVTPMAFRKSTRMPTP